MQFKELLPDQSFIFAIELDPTYQGLRGPFAKVDKRSYVRLDYNGKGIGPCYKIGSINAEVAKW